MADHGALRVSTQENWPADAFEQWFAAYPTQRARNFAKKAFEVVRKAGEIGFDEMVAATKQYAETVRLRGTEEQYITSPANWLEGGSYLDVPATAPSGITKPQRHRSTFSDKDWSQRVVTWLKSGDWSSHYGPAPREPSCEVPSAVLAEHGIASPATSPRPAEVDHPSGDTTAKRDDADAKSLPKDKEFTKIRFAWLDQVQAATKRKDISPLAFRALYVLATEYFRRDLFLKTGDLLAFPYQEDWAKEVGVTSRTIQDVVSAACDHLEVVSAHSPGRAKRYRAIIHTGTAVPVSPSSESFTPEPPRRHTGSTASGHKPLEEPFEKKVIDSDLNEDEPEEAAKMAPASKTAEPALDALVSRWPFIYQLQLWGASGQEALELDSRLQTAAGPHRVVWLGELFTRMKDRDRWAGARKIRWLAEQADRMAAQPPPYFPMARPHSQSKVRTKHDIVINLLKKARGHQLTKAQLIKLSGESLTYIANLTKELVDGGKIIRVSQGIFALPGFGVVHVSGTAIVVAVLAAEPSHRMHAVEIAKRSGRTRGTIDAAAFHLREDGLVLPARGKTGLVELSPSTLRRIESGEVIRSGRGDIVWAPAPAASCGEGGA